jgi:hypothetical protein
LTKKTLSIILTVFFFSFIFLSASKATLLENIPLDSWVYQAVDELYSQGLFASLHKNVKPYTRGEIASLVLDINLKQSDGGLKLTESQLWLISKLNQEFKYELEELYHEKHKDKENYTTFRYGTSPVAYLSLAEGDSSSGSTSSPSFDGRLQARFEMSLQFDRRFVLKDRVVIDTKAEKERRYRAREWKHHLAGTLDEAYAQVDLRYFHLLLGRDHLRWGPGRNDVLLLSDQIPPFDMIKMEGNVGSFKLVWFATVLDTIHVPSFWREWEPNYAFCAKRYLSGHRLNMKLEFGVEMGISEVVLYGGENRLPEVYYLNPILPFYGALTFPFRCSKIKCSILSCW